MALKGWIRGEFGGEQPPAAQPEQPAELSKTAEVSPILDESYQRMLASMQFLGLGGTPWSQVTYQQAAREAYLSNPIAYRGLRLWANAVKTVPMQVMERRAGKDEIVTQGPVARLFKRPNKFQGWPRLAEILVLSRKLSGDSFLLANIVGMYGELWALRPDLVVANPDAQGWPSSYFYTNKSGQRTTYSLDDVLHLYDWSPIKWVGGESPIGAAKRSVTGHNLSADHGVSLLQNDARPSAIVIVPGELTPQRREALQAVVDGTLSGASNRGRTLVLSKTQAADYQRTGLTPQELDFLQGKESYAREIITALEVPLELVFSDNATYNNRREARKSFYHESVIPYLWEFSEELNNWLLPRFGEQFRVDYDLSGIDALQEDADARSKRDLEAVAAGALTRNEWRTNNGREPSEEPVANRLTVAGIVTPLDEVGFGSDGSNTDPANY